MPLTRDAGALLAVSRLYYLEGRSQAEIASVMGTSRSNVSRLLSEAQRQGIVEIKIHDPGGRVAELEEALRERFGLREVRVAHTPASPGLRPEDQVGAQAARLLTEQLKDSMTIGLSWGQAVQSMVYATTSEQRHHGLTLVPLVGGLSAVRNEISGAELVRELALRLDAGYRMLHAPATFQSAAARDVLLAETSVHEPLAAAARADLAVVGIGSPTHGSSAAVLASLSLSAEEEREFWDAGPVGDIAARYYGPTGQPVLGAVADKVLAVSLDDLVAIPHVIGVAVGRTKASGVLGALRGHLVDSLVCDEALARHLISEARNAPGQGVE